MVPARGRVGVDAVRQQPVVARQRPEPVGRARVHPILAHVDVHPHAQIVRQPHHRVERGVRQGEAGVGADQAPAARPQEALVLGQARLGALGPVAVGHLVGAHHPHAHLGARLGDHVQAAVDGGGGGVVVDDGGRARLERLDRAEQGRPAHQVEVEREVEPPPDLLQDLREPGGRGRRRGHAPGQRRVEVMVGADEPAGRSGHAVVTCRRAAGGAWPATRRRGRAARRPPRRRWGPARSRPRP